MGILGPYILALVVLISNFYMYMLNKKIAKENSREKKRIHLHRIYERMVIRLSAVHNCVTMSLEEETRISAGMNFVVGRIQKIRNEIRKIENKTSIEQLKELNEEGEDYRLELKDLTERFEARVKSSDKETGKFNEIVDSIKLFESALLVVDEEDINETFKEFRIFMDEEEEIEDSVE